MALTARALVSGRLRTIFDSLDRASSKVFACTLPPAGATQALSDGAGARTSRQRAGSRGSISSFGRLASGFFDAAFCVMSMTGPSMEDAAPLESVQPTIVPCGLPGSMPGELSRFVAGAPPEHCVTARATALRPPELLCASEIALERLTGARTAVLVGVRNSAFSRTIWLTIASVFPLVLSSGRLAIEAASCCTAHAVILVASHANLCRAC